MCGLFMSLRWVGKQPSPWKAKFDRQNFETYSYTVFTSNICCLPRWPTVAVKYPTINFMGSLAIWPHTRTAPTFPLTCTRIRQAEHNGGAPYKEADKTVNNCFLTINLNKVVQYRKAYGSTLLSTMKFKTIFDWSLKLLNARLLNLMTFLT